PVLQRLRSDPPIEILVNNAGAALIGDFAAADPAEMYKLLRLNVFVPTLLASAVIGGMVERRNGAIINISSVLALLPEHAQGIYPATKSYLMTLPKGWPPKSRRRASMFKLYCLRPRARKSTTARVATSTKCPASWKLST